MEPPLSFLGLGFCRPEDHVGQRTVEEQVGPFDPEHSARGEFRLFRQMTFGTAPIRTGMGFFPIGV